METKIFDRFIKFKSIEVRENTITAYRQDINSLYKFLSEEKNIYDELELLKATTYNDLEDYIFNLIEKNMSVTTINRRIANIKAFFGYICNRQKLLEINQAEGLKEIRGKNSKVKQKKEKEVVTRDEYARLIVACDIRKKGAMLHEFTSARDKFLISLLASTGMRGDTARKIELQDIEKKGDYYIVEVSPDKHKAGSKISTPLRLPLVGVVKKYYEAYLFERSQLKNITDDTYLILSISGKKLDGINMQNIIKKLLEKANIEKDITLHSFRSFFKINAMGVGINNALISLIGGWTLGAVETTYAKDGKHLDDIKANEIIKILG